MNEPWEDDADQAPHDELTSAAQIAGVLELVGDATARILDLGCGAGRLVLPLARHGHAVVGVDHDARVLESCRNALDASGLDADLRGHDFQAALAEARGYDAVLLLGNTLMTLWRPDDAIALLRGVRACLAHDGILLVDDIAGAYWPEVAEGNWINGVDPEGTERLAWSDREPVFTLRRGEAVGDDGPPDPSERAYRLWDDGALTLLARLTGFSDPEPIPTACLQVWRPDDAGAH